MKPYTHHELGMISSILSDLSRISTSLHRLHEKACNTDLTPRDIAHQNKLRVDAETLAKSLGMRIYVQTDPRGAALFLGDETMNETNYSSFLCLEK